MKMRATITLDAVGGRTTPVQPRARTYRPHFVPEGSSSMLRVQLTNGPETMAPGECGDVEFECLYIEVSYDDLRPGVRFTVVEGGTPLGGVYRESYCFYDLAKGTGPGALEARLRAVTRKLGKHSALLRSWRRSGGRFSYYVTVHGEAAMGFSLSPELLSDIGRVGVELGVEALRAPK